MPSFILKQNLLSVSFFGRKKSPPLPGHSFFHRLQGAGLWCKGHGRNPGLLSFPAQGAGLVSVSKGAGTAMTQTQLSSEF